MFKVMEEFKSIEESEMKNFLRFKEIEPQMKNLLKALLELMKVLRKIREESTPISPKKHQAGYILREYTPTIYQDTVRIERYLNSWKLYDDGI